ncbi:MAG TPA: DUF2076 domain-containing protein [Stellaceae bacterium]|nr:DUF2076 domain-containing protein [Stellaceae bacterium]
MTPQERDLVVALLARLKQQASQPKDAEAEALIRQGMAEQPDAPYLLMQTVLIQDMALHDAQGRIAELERQIAAKAAPAPQAAASFLGGRGSVPASGAWPQRPSAAPDSEPPAPVWTQSRTGVPAAGPPPGAPQLLSGAGAGFLRQAAATAAGIAGGALLFQGIQSLFGPHYAGGFLGGAAQQPGLSEMVVNNHYGDRAAPDSRKADALPDQSDLPTDPGQDYASDQDISDTDIGDASDFGDDGGSYDV